MPKCKCCNSIHLEFINNALIKGISATQLSKELKQRFGIFISHDSISKHYKNHLLPKYNERNHILKMIYDTGNPTLARRIKKTQKILRQYKGCSCDFMLDRKVKKRGLVYICTICNGWIMGIEGRALVKKQKVQKKRKERKLVVTRSLKKRRLL